MHGHSIKYSGDRRLRLIHRLSDEDGVPRLIYDLERTFIIEVPATLVVSLEAALINGQINKDLREWLITEDLLTTSSEPGRTEAPTTIPPKVTDVSIDMSGSCNLGCVYCFENDIKSRIGPMTDETAMQSVAFAFKKSSGAPIVTLHFGSGEPLIRFDLLKKIVGEAKRLAFDSGQYVSFELTTNGSLVTKEIAEFFRDEPFNIRVSCDGPPKHQNRFRPLLGGQDSYPAVARGLRLFIEYLPDRLTVNSVLSGSTRLIELWEWANRFGFRHYHVIKVGAFTERDLNLQEKEINEFRNDLRAITDDMFSLLEAGRIPIDYQPITKIIRRLMIPQPVTRFCGVASTYLGVASNGKVYPCFRHLGVEEYDLGDVQGGVNDQKRIQFLRQEAANVDDRPICQDCWARYLCGGGCYADSTIYGPDKLKPQIHHCPFWRAEADASIRLYNRMLKTNPSYCLGLFGASVESVLNANTSKNHA
jgi:uncharacterized protein